MNQHELSEENTHKFVHMPVDADMCLQVARYAEWLSAQARHNTPANATQEMKEYVENAGKTVLIGSRRIEIFAPFHPEHSALQTITKWQAIGIVVFLIAWEVGLHVFREGMLIATLAAITALYLSHLLLNIVLSFNTFRHSSEEKIDESIISALTHADWPPYTILCPLYREAKVVPQFIQAMEDLDYPTDKLQILLLTEEDDVETRQAIRTLLLPRHFKIVTVPDGSPRTKPRACNFGLMQATGQYVVIYDAEDLPEPMQLKKAVLTFANHGPNMACVQAKLNFYNPYQNLLTRLFTAEYSLWFDLILPGLQRSGLSIPLGGTSNHFPTQILRALGAWDAFNVTEDCDLGLRLAQYHLKTVVLDSTTYEEANSQLKNWIRQRSRWIKGYMQTYLVNMREPLRYLHVGRIREFISLQLVIGGKTAFLFLNPLLWILFAVYLFLRPVVGDAFHTLFPKPLLYIGSISLIFGNFFFIYVYILGCIKRKQYRLIKWSLLVPLYWGLMSIAAAMALFQLIMAPHYWEKTEHGLHINAKRSKYPLPDPIPLDTFAAVTEALTVPMPASRHSIAEAPTARMPASRHSIAEAPTARMPAFTHPIAETPTARMPAFTHPIAEAPTARMPATAVVKKQGAILSVTTSLRAITTLPVPAFSSKERVALLQPKRTIAKDPWLFATFFLACIASIASCWYFFQQHQILLYGDAYAHLMIARRVFDNSSPGLAQLGGVWVPLPHMLMLPFIWNDFLWRTGLAGSLPSMLCYIITALYLFLAAYRLTQNSRASFIGTLVFILNPNVLYLQSTPLSELLCFATLAMACYYFLAWAQDDQPKYLVFAAISTFLATLARYDGWALFIALFFLIVCIGWVKRQGWLQIQGNLINFAILGSLGIALWFLWCAIIFNDPLYFQHGAYSSQVQQAEFLHNHALYTYHNLLQSFRFYTLLTIDTLGPILCLLAILSVFVFILHNRLKPEMLASLAFLIPFGFYVVSLYTGQVTLFVPEAVPANAPDHLFNARFGAEMVAPAALFVAILAGQWSFKTFRRSLVIVWQGLLVVIIVVQALLLAQGGIITIQDGQYGRSCMFPHPINGYLAQHYAGGRILEDIFTSRIDGADAGLQLKEIIYEGSNQLWTMALNDPASVVDWVIVDPTNQNDLVTQHIEKNSQRFLVQFTLVLREPHGLSLYHRVGLPPVPTRPLPSILLTEHSLCKTDLP